MNMFSALEYNVEEYVAVDYSSGKNNKKDENIRLTEYIFPLCIHEIISNCTKKHECYSKHLLKNNPISNKIKFIINNPLHKIGEDKRNDFKPFAISKEFEIKNTRFRLCTGFLNGNCKNNDICQISDFVFCYAISNNQKNLNIRLHCDFNILVKKNNIKVLSMVSSTQKNVKTQQNSAVQQNSYATRLSILEKEDILQTAKTVKTFETMEDGSTIFDISQIETIDKNHKSEMTNIKKEFDFLKKENENLILENEKLQKRNVELFDFLRMKNANENVKYINKSYFRQTQSKRFYDTCVDTRVDILDLCDTIV
jgi:regulator of replication initiation timing